MFSNDPRIDPNNANVVGASELRQPYTRRAMNAILGFAFALVVFGAIVGWFFFSPSNDNEDTAPSNQQTQQLAVNSQMPGNDYSEGSGRSAVYNFFYKMFGGIEDGLEDSPHNLKNVEHVQNAGLGPLQTKGDSPTITLDRIAERRAAYINAQNQDEYRHSVRDVVGSEVYGVNGEKAGSIFDILVNKETGQARAIIVNDDDARYERDLTAIGFKNVIKQQSDGDVSVTMAEEKVEDKPDYNYSSIEDTNYVSLRNLYDGQLIDFEGNVTGQIDAVIYENAEAQNVYFTLRATLAQALGARTFALPFDEVNIIESADGYDIKLTKEQTLALAQHLTKE